MRQITARVGRAVLTVVVLAMATMAGVTAACGRSTGAATPVPTDPGTSATGPTPLSQPIPQLPATVTSADGEVVTVTDVSRILPLRGNIAEVVFGLGLGEHVVGRDITATFPEAAHLPLVSRSHDVTAEAALALQPTVVLTQTDAGPSEAIAQLRAVGVPVVLLDMPASIDDITPRIELIAAALGVPAAGAALIDQTNAAIAAVQARIPPDAAPPRVAFLYLRGQAGVYLIGGPRSGADSMIAAAGALDAGTAIGLSRPFTPITSEALVQAAPDILLMTASGLDSVGGIDGLLTIPGIAQTPAGVNRRVVTVEDGLLYAFGSRTPEALGILIDAFHRDR